MTNLEEVKLKEEIKGLRTSRYYDIFKGIALVVGSIALFIVIQMPESVLNKKASQETINRERAKLIFEVIHNNKDFESIVLELSVIEKAYPENDTIWLNDIKSIYKTRLDKKNNNDILNSIDTTKDRRVSTIRIELNSLYDKKEQYQTGLMLEVQGQKGSGLRGYGPVAREMEQRINEINQRILLKEKELDSLK